MRSHFGGEITVIASVDANTSTWSARRGRVRTREREEAAERRESVTASEVEEARADGRTERFSLSLSDIGCLTNYSAAQLPHRGLGSLSRFEGRGREGQWEKRKKTGPRMCDSVDESHTFHVAVSPADSHTDTHEGIERVRRQLISQREISLTGIFDSLPLPHDLSSLPCSRMHVYGS